MSYTNPITKDLSVFYNWLLKIGDRDVGGDNDSESKIDILDDISLGVTNDPIAKIVTTTYPSFLGKTDDPNYSKKRLYSLQRLTL